jgi:hypothetical protein
MTRLLHAAVGWILDVNTILPTHGGTPPSGGGRPGREEKGRDEGFAVGEGLE